MKRIVSTIIGVISICLMLSACGSPEGVKINAENFPDENFREYLLASNYGKDRVITDEEILDVTNIDVEEYGITDLSGIEVFVNLKKLECHDNQLSQLDLTHFKNLESLSCNHNQLTELNLKANVALSKLECNDNKIENLDLTNNVNLTYIDCNDNQISSINITACSALKYLFCANNSLTELDVSGNTKLKELVCTGNNLNYLDTTANTELSSFSSDFGEFYPDYSTSSEEHDDTVKEGMSRSQVENLWGAPVQTSVKVFSDGTLTYCWYYDANGTYRWVIYNSNNIVASVF